jgi:radical SAM superfamily enzyme YgiQ (UPF0313 family)
MQRRAFLVELSDYERILPLASGYLQAYAQADPELREDWSFAIHTRTVRVERDALLAELVAADADVYGLSTYVWNGALVRWLAPRLARARPASTVVLGGPQVVHQPRYLDPELENLITCNGEGERTFANLLRELSQERPGLERVRGLMFHSGRALVETEEEPKIQSLDEIPSPFLTGVFPPDTYTQAIFETNRGCPFKCSFCYWGLGDQRVTKFSEERLHEELEWLARNHFVSIFFADANFGMLERDVRIAEHLAETRRTRGVPYMVSFNSAKNKPERLVEIAKIVQQAGIHTTQSIAVQSLDEDTLRKANRGNIRLAAYTKAQEELNAARIGSYVELIWPLPGETLTSFQHGVERLCEMESQSFVIYPLILLPNTTMHQRKAELGLVTIEDEVSRAAEYELVVATKEVGPADYDAGIHFVHAAKGLYNTRALRSVGRFLHRTGQVRWAALYRSFVDWCAAHPDEPYVIRTAQSIRDRSYTAYAYWGRIYHEAFHACRDDHDRLVHAFASSQPWWDGDAQLLFELDLVLRPYLYSNTKIAAKTVPLRSFELEPIAGGYRVRAAPDAVRRLAELAIPHAPPPAERPLYQLVHKRDQLPYMARESADKNYNYCYGAVERIERLVPEWRAVPA